MENQNNVITIEKVDCSNLNQFASMLLAKTNTAEIFEINTVEDLQKANQLKVQIRGDIKKVDDARMDKTRPLDEAKKVIKQMYDSITDKPLVAMKTLDRKMIAFSKEQDRLAKIEKARIEKENEKKRIELEKRIEKAKKPETVERLEEELEETEMFSAVPEVVKPKVKGLTIVTDYHVNVTDIDKVSDMFIIKTVDEKAIKALAKSKQGNIKLDGIKITTTTRTVSRG